MLREPNFLEIPGLVLNFYVKSSIAGEYGGVYLWDTLISLNSYRESDLAKSIPSAYAISETPDVEIMDIIFQLREL